MSTFQGIIALYHGNVFIAKGFLGAAAYYVRGTASNTAQGHYAP